MYKSIIKLFTNRKLLNKLPRYESFLEEATMEVLIFLCHCKLRDDLWLKHKLYGVSFMARFYG